jgi:4-cresol dehydrogenase (hydroxylating)
MTTATAPRTALHRWIEILGDRYVIQHPDRLRAAGTATFPASQAIPVILQPADLDQIQAIVRIANSAGQALYPVSSGKNWGYGSGVPVRDGCAILDLSRLNQITDYRESLGYVTVQPGVTQADLFAFLRQKQSGLWMDATGSSPDCSLIGNAMERGFGHTPYGDHFAQICNLEVVLANGELIRTGFGSLPKAKAASVYRWGTGPTLDGLFSQSNFGIVTAMTLWLMPAPEYFQAFFFQCEKEESISEVVNALRPLRMNGTLRSAVHIGNDYKVLAGMGQFPELEERPLMPARMKHLRSALKFGRWSGSGGLYGTRRQVSEARRLLRTALAGKTDQLRFLDDRTLHLASRFQGVYKVVTGLDLAHTLELVRPVFGLLKGVPTRKTLGSAYWRKSIPVPPDPNPDRDRCGLLWLAPIAPMEGTHAARLAALAEPAILRDGFEPQISFTLVTERALACIVSIAWDRDLPGEDDRAMTCYFALRHKFESEGYFSYRQGIADMDRSVPPDSYRSLLQSFRQTLDPNGIIAPGRYQ